MNVNRVLQRMMAFRYRGEVPDDWAPLLEEVPFVRTLAADEIQKLVQLSRMFETIVRFDSRHDIEVTQRMIRLTALQACRLILALGYEPYRYLGRVTFLPNSFEIEARQGEVRANGAADERGHVALSWREVLIGLDDTDARNVVYHEFAHVLDGYDGVMDGRPDLHRDDHDRWTHVVGGAYERHRGRRRKSLIDAYGRTSEIEFFAEVVEVFFERPEELHVEQRDLYEALATYFNQRPGWLVED